MFQREHAGACLYKILRETAIAVLPHVLLSGEFKPKLKLRLA